MKITVSQDRVLFAATGGSRRYVRLLFEAPRAAQAERLPLSLALVLDRSGSMQGAKFDLAREAAIRCLGLLRPSDSIALITYDTTVQIVLPARPATPETLAELRSLLAVLQTGSSTNLEGGWLAGADAAASAGLPRMRVLLVTDGLANVGETHPIALCRHARELRERGLFTSTIGVGADFDEVLLLQIAEYGGGNFHFVDEPEQFEPVLAGELGEALAPFAEEISVHVTVRPQAECHVLGERLVHPADGGWIVRVGSLAAGRTTDLVLRVDPPIAVIGDELVMQLATHWSSALDGQRHVEETCGVSFVAATTHANQAQERDVETIVRVTELRVADVQRRALEFNREGQYDPARELILAEHRDLRSLVEGNACATRIWETLVPFAEEVNAVMELMERMEHHERSYTTQRSRASYRRLKETT